MSEMCEQFCPSYEECRGRIEGLEAAQQSLLSERTSLETTRRLVQESSTNHALKVLQGVASGNSRWTSSEHLDDDLDLITTAPAWSRRVDGLLQDNSHNLSQAYDAEPAVMAAQTTCPGPRLNLAGRILLATDILLSGSDRLKEDRELRMSRHAKCGSSAAVMALRKIPKP